MAMANKGSGLPKNLHDFAKSLSSLSVPVMEGREKGILDDVINAGKPVTIRDYDFLTVEKKGVKSTFAVIILDEYPEHFFFTGMVITEQLSKMDESGYHDEIVENGLPMLLEVKKSQANKGLSYTDVTWYPGV